MNSVKTTGQRSPRWAFWSKMLIPCKDGVDYLFRLRIVQTPLFGVYVHDIYEDDHGRDPHNHPWSFISIVLRGSYVENIHDDTGEIVATHTHKRFSVHTMGRENYHQIIHASSGLKTLILTGRRASSWGFLTPLGHVDWKAYEELQDPVMGVRGS